MLEGPRQRVWRCVSGELQPSIVFFALKGCPRYCGNPGWKGQTAQERGTVETFPGGNNSTGLLGVYQEHTGEWRDS